MGSQPKIIVPGDVVAQHDGSGQILSSICMQLFDLTRMVSSIPSEQNLIIQPLNYLATIFADALTSQKNIAFWVSNYVKWVSGDTVDIPERQLASVFVPNVFYGYVLGASAYIVKQENNSMFEFTLWTSNLTGDGVFEDAQNVYRVTIPMTMMLFWIDSFVFGRSDVDVEALVSAIDKPDDNAAVLMSVGEQVQIQRYILQLIDSIVRTSWVGNSFVLEKITDALMPYWRKRIVGIRGGSSDADESNQNGVSADRLDCGVLYKRQS